MQEELIGYLLGALEPNEQQRVFHALNEDLETRAALERLRQGLVLLEAQRDEYEAPVRLAVRTLERIRFHIESGSPPTF